MPSAFSPNLNLELQANGEHTDTWGIVLNNGALTPIDSALGGVLALSLSNANVTLTTTQTQNNTVVLSGTLTANVAIIFPQIGRNYFVANNTAGAFSVTLKTTAVAGAVYVIPQGVKRFVTLASGDVVSSTDTFYSPVLNTPTVNGGITIQNTDPGAGAAPVTDNFRDSVSPLATDVLAQNQWNGRNSAAAKVTYAADDVVINVPTSTLESGLRRFWTIVSGVLAVRFNIANGFYAQGVTGGDKGAGTVNAMAVYEAGVKLDSRGLAKAWVSFNGATGPTILASYNVSSVTRNGAGDYTVNFTSAFANTNYAVVGSCEAESSFPNEVRAVSVRNGGLATGSARVKTGLTGSNTFDLPGVFLAFFSN